MLHFSFFTPACLSALFRVPGGMSIPGFPATVTVPLSSDDGIGGDFPSSELGTTHRLEELDKFSDFHAESLLPLDA